MAGLLLACLFVVFGGASHRASAMEIDCSTIGGPGHLTDYVEDFGVRCAGGSGGGSSGGGAGAGGGCALNTDRVPAGFFDIFRNDVSIVNTSDEYSLKDGEEWTTMKFYRVGTDGKFYLAGVLTSWNSLRSSGIIFYNYLGGAVQIAQYDTRMPCSDGYRYDIFSVPDVGDSAASAAPLIAPGLTSSVAGSAQVRGSLALVPTTADRLLLRLDVTNTNSSMSTPFSVSMIMKNFDVNSVVAHTGLVDCGAARASIQDCAVAELAPGSTQSMTLLLTAHPGSLVDADIPIFVSSRSSRTASNMRFYSAIPTPAASIDPVPTPPVCAAIQPGTQTVIAGLPSRVMASCYNALPMQATAAHGAAGIDSYGNLSYTPDMAYRGPDTITVTASNAHGKVSGATTVGVTVVDPPHAEADAYKVTYETPFTSTEGLLANDSIAGAAALPIPDGWYAQQGTTPPGHGSLVLNRDGTFTYTPDKGYSGPDAFKYRLEGPDSATSNAVTVTLDVVVP